MEEIHKNILIIALIIALLFALPWLWLALGKNIATAHKWYCESRGMVQISSTDERAMERQSSARCFPKSALEDN